MNKKNEKKNKSELISNNIESAKCVRSTVVPLKLFVIQTHSCVDWS